VVSLLAFAALIYWHPNPTAGVNAQAIVNNEALPEMASHPDGGGNARNEAKTAEVVQPGPEVAVATIALMFCAGAIGGSLYSFRGLIKHCSEEDYTRSHDLSYYFRPLSSGISGLFVFFLLLSGAITLVERNQWDGRITPVCCHTLLLHYLPATDLMSLRRN
jgi:hypothetical protein